MTVWRRMLQRSTCQITDAPDSAAPYSSEQSAWIATALSSQPHSRGKRRHDGMIASVADKKTTRMIVIAVPIASPAGAPIRQRRRSSLLRCMPSTSQTEYSSDLCDIAAGDVGVSPLSMVTRIVPARLRSNPFVRRRLMISEWEMRTKTAGSRRASSSYSRCRS